MKAALLLAGLLLAGCASSSGSRSAYDVDLHQTTYESTRVLLGHRDMSAGLVAGQRVMLKAVATCPGRDCTPEVVDLLFLNSGSGVLHIDNRRIEITFDDTTLSWEDEDRRIESGFNPLPPGEFARFRLSFSDFSRLSRSTHATVAFGQTSTALFPLSPSALESFREFVASTNPSS